MAHAEHPTGQVGVGLACLEMLKEHHEGVLNNFLAVVSGYAKREQVAQQRASQPLKETHKFVFAENFAFGS